MSDDTPSRLPIERIFLPDTRSPRVRELPFRFKIFSHRDIEHVDRDGYYLCTYCEQRLPADYQPRTGLYRLCKFCEVWYCHCFGTRDIAWINRAYRNMNERVNARSYRARGVEVRIDYQDFSFLSQTLLVPFRFFYPFERPSIDRHFRISEEWPHYSASTMAIVPHALNSTLRDGCLSLEDLLQYAIGCERQTTMESSPKSPERSGPPRDASAISLAASDISISGNTMRGSWVSANIIEPNLRIRSQCGTGHLTLIQNCSITIKRSMTRI
jgi:hypothetical protein